MNYYDLEEEGCGGYRLPNEIQPEPSIEEMCGPEHKYYGNDERGGRCYCGKVRYSGLDRAIMRLADSLVKS